jgi:hypothetical protein
VNLVPTATIELDKPRKLRLDLNALADYERASGRSIMSDGFSLETLGVSDIRTLLWACLVQEDESLTEREVGSLLHAGNLSEVSQALTKLLTGAMPDPEDGAGDPLPAEGAGASTG